MLKKIIAGICATILILGMGVNVFADESNRPVIENRVKEKIPAELLKSVETMKKYITVSANEVMSFDEKAAIANGEEERIIELGHALVEFSFAMLADPIETRNQAIERIYLVVYGNWCGPEHSGGSGGGLDPVDALDALCKAHDLCYAAAWENNPSLDGKQICSCDQTLMSAIVALYPYLNQGQKQTADLIYDYFYLSQIWCK